jgi:hypothetical protein
MAISVADKIEMHEAISRLYLAIDGHDPEGFAGCFSPDGVFNANKYGEFKGRQAVAGFLRDHIARGNEDGARHCLTNFVVDDTPGAPTLRAYVMKFRIDKLPAVTVGTASLTARFKKGDDGWMLDRLDLGMPIPVKAA